VGASTPHLYDSILDFTPDLEIVLDQLGVGRVAVIRLSGAALRALAAACALGKRVAAVGVLGGPDPTEVAQTDAVVGTSWQSFTTELDVNNPGHTDLRLQVYIGTPGETLWATQATLVEPHS